MPRRTIATEADIAGIGLHTGACTRVTCRPGKPGQGVVFRRTDLATAGDPGEAALRAAARIMGECLGWDASQLEAELRYVRSRLDLARSGRALLAEPAVPRVLVA